MKQILNNFLTQDSNHRKIDILNVGCGGSREIRELPSLQKTDASFSLIDFDDSALIFSKDKIKEQKANAQITTIKIDVHNLYKKSIPLPSKYNLIYSIGLFDYLSDSAVYHLTKTLYSHLKKSGIFIFAHKDYCVYDPFISDWFCDWKYFSRTKEDIIKILSKAGIDTNKVRFSREKDGYIYFLHIRNE